MRLNTLPVLNVQIITMGKNICLSRSASNVCRIFEIIARQGIVLRSSSVLRASDFFGAEQGGSISVFPAEIYKLRKETASAVGQPLTVPNCQNLHHERPCMG